MRFRKLVSSFLTVTLVVTGFALPTSAAVDRATFTYLQNQSKSNAWVIMALRSGGQTVSANSLSTSFTTATDIERTILAVTAAGQDASNWRGINLINRLDGERNNNQIGNTTLINDDIFGILAYYSAGIPTTDRRIAESREFLLKHQNSDGGWSHSTISSSDTNDTAMAITALIRAGLSQNDQVISRAINYLSSAQNSDGGFGITPGAESDSASTAWIISALQVAGKAPASFTNNNKTPFMFLETVKHTDASYKWKPNEGSGNPTMTAYVAIALAGTGYPVATRNASNSTTVSRTNNSNTGSNSSTTSTTNTNRVGSPTRGAASIQYRIEGSQNQICQGSVNAATPLELIEVAASQCGYSYFIDQTSFGRYLQRLGPDQAIGSSGWLYLVNWQQPSVGGDAYQLKAGDYVTWYFGQSEWKPLRAQLINRATAQTQGNPTIEVQELQSNNVWRSVSGATVHVNGRTATTNSGGQATFSLGIGSYQYYATRPNNVRSARESFTVSSRSSSVNNNNSSNRINRSIPLSTTVVQRNNTTFTNNTNDTISVSSPQMSFNISTSSSGSNLAFGSLQAGQTNTQNVVLTNTGNTSLLFTASVTGDSIFVNNLRLNNRAWSNFSQRINRGSSSRVDVSLTIPNDNTSGFKTGDLIFWANQ